MRLYTIALLVSATLASGAAAQPANTHFVVFNAPGPNAAALADKPDIIAAHRAVYRAYADACLTLAGGRLAGATPLGVTIFIADVDEAAIKEALEKDPAVVEGYISLDYRTLEIQMGALPTSRPDCTPKQEAEK